MWALAAWTNAVPVRNSAEIHMYNILIDVSQNKLYCIFNLHVNWTKASDQVLRANEIK
jgi:L-rhamnose mutarotase